MKWGTEYPERHDLSLAAPARHRWASRSTPRRGSGTAPTSAGGACPVVDTWWQTETGNIMISPLPGVTHPEARVGPPAAARRDGRRRRLRRPERPARRGRLPRAHRALAGHAAHPLRRRRPLRRDVLEPAPGQVPRRRRLPPRQGRRLLAAGAHRRRHERLRATACRRSRSRARWWTTPRSPRRPWWAAPTRRPARRSPPSSPSRGTWSATRRSSPSCASTWPPRSAAIARPQSIVLTDDLPKTRSGKIMRRLLRDISEDRQLGDVTTLANEDVVQRDRRHGRDARAAGKEE